MSSDATGPPSDPEIEGEAHELFAAMREHARQSHELFAAMREQGWTNEQILELWKAVLGGD